MIQLIEYVDEEGKIPYARWLDSLDQTVKARIVITVYRLSAGNSSASKGVGGIFELRLDFGPGYRVYFGKDGEELVLLLGGGSKRRQQQDIESAKDCWQAYKRSKLAKEKRA